MTDLMQIGMALVLSELNVDYKRKDNFREKKNAVYLANAAGVKPSNHFWYWHYCGRVAAQGLGDDFLTILAEANAGCDDSCDWCLDEERKMKLANLRPLFEFSDLELLTSTHFLLTRSQAKNAREVRRTLGKFDRVYDQTLVDDAMVELRKYSLLV